MVYAGSGLIVSHEIYLASLKKTPSLEMTSEYGAFDQRMLATAQLALKTVREIILLQKGSLQNADVIGECDNFRFRIYHLYFAVLHPSELLHTEQKHKGS